MITRAGYLGIIRPYIPKCRKMPNCVYRVFQARGFPSPILESRYSAGSKVGVRVDAGMVRCSTEGRRRTGMVQPMA